MANIRVDLNDPIVDGQSLTFKAPCDCTEVTGIKVYYPGEDGTVSKTFSFRDAHNNNLSNLGDLFVEGAYVRVVLDTTNNRAYLQNADTNGYLEEKFVDYIVEQGTSGDWTYRKWSSGVAECWCEKSVGLEVAAFVAWGSIYYCSPGQLTYPSNLFSEAPHEQITMIEDSGSFWFTVKGNGTKAKVSQILPCSATKPTVNKFPKFRIYAKGVWK